MLFKIILVNVNIGTLSYSLEIETDFIALRGQTVGMKQIVGFHTIDIET